MNADVVVIGGGIVGASCAYFLAWDGVDVALLDRGGLAAGASGAGEGNILLSDKAPGPELELAKLGCALWEDLARELPDDFEYERKGALVVAESGDQMDGQRAHVDAMRGAGVEAELLDAAALREAEPHLAHDLPGASYFPTDAQVQPMLACAALLRAARRHGARIFHHVEVTALRRGAAGAMRGVDTTAGALAAPTVVVACGAWSGRVARLAGAELPVVPRKGHIVVTEPLPRLVRHKVMEAGYADAVSSGDAALQVAAVVEDTRSGSILLGSSREMVGFDRSIDVSVVGAIVRRALRFFPRLRPARAVRAYVGFRPFMPDHLPAIGATGVPGLYVNTGHEGAGICLGPISGKLLSQMICGESPALDASPFSPCRF